MKIKAALAALLLAGSAAVGQPVELPPVRYPDLPEIARDAAGFVPQGWTIVARRAGDLNGDRVADLAVLLKMTDRANVVPVPVGDETASLDTNPHLLLVAFSESGGYRLAAHNRGLFPRRDVPFTGDVPPNADTLRMERGSLIVFFEYLRGWASYRFRWNGGGMRLIGYDDGGVSGGCISTTSINFLTGRARLTVSRQESGRQRTAWRRVQGAAPPTLDRIDIDQFYPESTIAGPPLLCDYSGDA